MSEKDEVNTSTTDSNVAGGGIFSTPDLTIESGNIPANVGGTPVMDETAATPISENSSRIASVFANTDATSQMQDVNVAMQANSNSTTSTATGDIKLAPSANPKSKAPLIIIALLVLAGVGALVWATVTGRLGGEETGNVAEHTTLEEARKSFDRFATYVLFGTSEDTLDDIYNPNKEYRIETESYAESYNTEFWDEAEQLLVNASNSRFGNKGTPLRQPYLRLRQRWLGIGAGF